MWLNQRELGVGDDPRPLHADGAQIVLGSDAELHPAPAVTQLAAAALFHRVNREPCDVPLAVAGEGPAMALPPRARAPPKPAPSAATPGSMDAAAFCLTETQMCVPTSQE